jgi:glucan phosphoethanolaminetransferase (alkaline phosphatase superfamily)
LVLGSNFLWSKTITFSIIRNYVASTQELLLALPVEAWISYVLFIFDLLICLVLYVSCKPESNVRHISFKNAFKNSKTIRITLYVCFAFLVLATSFQQPLMDLKRDIHFAEEPLLEFTLGPMWGEKNEMAFDMERYSKGIKDSVCIKTIKPVATANRNVMIILIDALRSDHLNMYGYSRITTPFLDSLYKQKKLQIVENAFSTSTNTIGGIAGLFFSRDWKEFGFNGLSLMKFLKLSDYTTYAFLTGFHRDWYGLSALYRGNCDYYYESSSNPKIKSDDDLITLSEFKKTKLRDNAFIYIHLLSTHMVGKKNEAFKKFLPDKVGVYADKATALINNYDNGILQADFCIKEIFQKLEIENKLDKTTIFILADHGEMFGENNIWGHGGSVHPSLITVPLLIYDSHIDWYRNLSAATLKDIAPTIAERIGSTVPACWEGKSLHSLPADFNVPVESVENCEFPYGLLKKRNDTIELKIMDVKRKVIKSVKKNSTGKHFQSSWLMQ